MPRRKNVNPETGPTAQEEVTQPNTETAEPIAAKKPARRRLGAPKPEAQPELVLSPEPVAEKKPRRGLFRRAPKETKPEVVQVVEEALIIEEAQAVEILEQPATTEKAARTRGRRGGKKEAVSEVAAPIRSSVSDDFSDLGFDMPVPVFRTKKEDAPARTSGHRNKPTAEQQEKPERKGRNRRNKASDVPAAEEKQRRPESRRETKPKVVDPPFVPEPLPQKPVRPIIPIPEDAPQVVLRSGIPTLVRDHRVYPPMAFFGSSSDPQQANTVYDEMKMAGEAGVHLHSHLVEFEVDPRSVESSVQFAAYMLNKSIEADPEAQVLFRLVFIAPAGWTENYSDARYNTADGMLAEPSISDDKFWDVAKECLNKFVQTLRLLDQKDHILGVHLERGEWFYGQGWGYDTSVAAKNKFRDWARVRYRNDVVALRAAWFDGTTSFNSLTIPEYRPDKGAPEKFIRSSRRERRWVDYHLFLSDSIVERIGDLAYAAKQASEGYFLVGASYGYTFEWSHPASGHLSLGKLLRTPEIDFIAGPPSYSTRQPGGAAPFPGPIDSFALNGKLYISEEDFKTSIGGKAEPDDFNPVIKTPQALESVHWRGAGSALAHASGVCWMDLWGNGWLKTPGIWDRASHVRDFLIRRMAAPLQDPDVAIFIDERALAYLVDEEAFALLVQNVRESVLRSGLNAAFYLLSDLQHREKFPESKLYVFLNAWDVRPDLRAAIKNRLQKDNKVLFWIFAAGLFDSGRDSLERAREVTGIALKPQPFHSRPGTTILNRKHPLCEAFPDRAIGGAARMEPSYFAIPEEATVLGEYTATGLPSFVVKEFNQDRDATQHWKSVFLGEPTVTPGLLRALAHMAGVHVWNYQEDVVHVRPPFLSVHCTGAGPRTLTLPNKWSAYNLQSSQWLQSESSSIRVQATDGSTHLFLAGPKEELDQILSAPTEDLLHMAELPARSDDTVRFDAAGFDVPIMRLDEWMEGGDQEDSGDEFLFRPKFTEEPGGEEEPVSNDRGRRTRRRRGGRDRGEEPVGQRVEVSGGTGEEGDDMSLSVVFRRRN